MTETFKVDAQCRSCNGTGLYSGMAEQSGAAIVCHTCKGTGLELIEVKYTPFIGRQPTDGVQRVYAANPGIGIGVGKGFTLESFGGVTFVEWLDDPASVNKPGREMRRFTCPAWWYQSANYKLKPEFRDDERRCGFGSFSRCEFFAAKAGCWEKWDREIGSKLLKGSK